MHFISSPIVFLGCICFVPVLVVKEKSKIGQILSNFSLSQFCISSCINNNEDGADVEFFVEVERLIYES
jgi:hypothetical protein